MRSDLLKRRAFITLVGGAVAWPLAVRAQQPTVPVVGLVSGRSLDTSALPGAAFTKGLSEAGYVDDKNVMVEYHWVGGQYDRLPSLMADLVRRRAAVIATTGDPPTLAAKATTATIPIVFGMSEDPVRHGVVASLAHPGGNATGINFLTSEVLTKRLGLLHELAPKALRIAVLINPANTPSAEATLREVPEAARAIGLQVQILKANTSREIEAAFATIVRDRADALFVQPDGFFNARRVQFATLAMRYRIPAAYPARDIEGQNIVIDYRFADGKFDRLPQLFGVRGPDEFDRTFAAITSANAATLLVLPDPVFSATPRRFVVTRKFGRYWRHSRPERAFSPDQLGRKCS